jgi:ABC-type transport system involved in cytochrome c biogenesis permease subunit
MDRITLLCFVASYSVALLLEAVQLFWPRPVQRLAALGFGAAGLVAHTLFLADKLFLGDRPRPLAEPYGSLLLLAWIVAVFCLYGTLHYRRLAWAVFVLPVVLGLIALAELAPRGEAADELGLGFLKELRGERFWGVVHGGLLLLAAVGVCVGFVASVMYLIQARRLKAKTPPGRGLHLPSLERLERMNRHAIDWSFPLLTAGVLVGAVLLVQRAGGWPTWADPRIFGTVVLWLVFALLLYLRYGVGLRGRRQAYLTILTFGLLLVTLVSEHTTPLEGR